MLFAYRLTILFAAVSVFAVSGLAATPAFATEAKLDTETCNQLRLEHMKYVASGAAADVQHGPEWGKANLSSDKLRDIELFIQLEEQINFGCRDAKLTMDAQRAAEAAKRLEMNPDLDPTAPLPAETESTGDSDGTGDAAGGASSSDAKPKAKLKPKAERKKKSDDAFKADANSGEAAAPASSPPVSSPPAATP
jgi:hypothetical protein